MLAIERKNKILGRLREEKSVLVGELAKEFGVSEETIRRDLDKLEKESGVIKTYGGALLRDGTERELPYVERRKINVEAKKAIAALAARRRVVSGLADVYGGTFALFVPLFLQKSSVFACFRFYAGAGGFYRKFYLYAKSRIPFIAKGGCMTDWLDMLLDQRKNATMIYSMWSGYRKKDDVKRLIGVFEQRNCPTYIVLILR